MSFSFIHVIIIEILNLYLYLKITNCKAYFWAHFCILCISFYSNTYCNTVLVINIRALKGSTDYIFICITNAERNDECWIGLTMTSLKKLLKKKNKIQRCFLFYFYHTLGTVNLHQKFQAATFPIGKWTRVIIISKKSFSIFFCTVVFLTQTRKKLSKCLFFYGFSEHTCIRRKYKSSKP